MARWTPRIAAMALVALVAAGTSAGARQAHRAPKAKRIARTNRVSAPNDPLWPKQWGLRSAGGASIWRWGHGSPRVNVAVLDTGVDGAQPDLRGAVVGGWNTIAQNADTEDDNGHGTLVAGIIAARGGNHTGIAGYCWRCSIMPVKVLDSSGRGSGAGIAAGIAWAVAHGAAVINMSFVLDHADPVVASAVADAVARGVLVVASAGNMGGAAIQYPAGYPGVISVGGVDPTGTLYPWSTFGAWTTVSTSGCNETTSLGGYDEFCGSSSATAALSGLLALAASDAPAAVPRLPALLAANESTAARRVDLLGFLDAVTRSDRRAG